VNSEDRDGSDFRAAGQLGRLAVPRATCLNSDPRASTATKHCHRSHLKRAFAPTSARFARRVSTTFWEMSARTAVVVSFLGQSDRRQIGKATTSLAKIRQVPRSSSGQLTLKLMPYSRLESKTFRRRNDSAPNFMTASNAINREVSRLDRIRRMTANLHVDSSERSRKIKRYLLTLRGDR
jgi:hypothetical protein